jgi:hypothetical protein
LCLSSEPSAFYFSLYTHLQSTILLPFTGGTKCQVLFFINALNSASIASLQTLLCIASSTLRGSLMELKKPYRTCPSVYTLDLQIPSCSRVRGCAVGVASVGAAAILGDDDRAATDGVVDSDVGAARVEDLGAAGVEDPAVADPGADVVGA